MKEQQAKDSLKYYKIGFKRSIKNLAIFFGCIGIGILLVLGITWMAIYHLAITCILALCLVVLIMTIIEAQREYWITKADAETRKRIEKARRYATNTGPR